MTSRTSKLCRELNLDVPVIMLRVSHSYLILQNRRPRDIIFIAATADDVKIKLSLCLTTSYTMKTYWGSEGMTPIFDLGSRRR